jgi:AcrR family transcriptional regulator
MVSKGEATRQSVLTHAVAQARVVGLDGLTIGRLADDLGLSKSGLFAHFKSKEKLQVAVIEESRRAFVAEIIAPALRKPRGEPRVRALFEGWLAWSRREGGCFFVAASAELDDRTGPARDALVAAQRDWLDTLAQAAQIAVEEDHFRRDLDTRQFAYELESLMLGFHHLGRLLDDRHAVERARRAVEALIERSRG